MNITRTSLITLAALALTSGSALAQVTINQAKALAGGVSPSDGPGFPVQLNVPGHYVLTGNLLVPFGQVGIQIGAPNVTLDLNGYQIHGGGECTHEVLYNPVTCIQPYSPASDGVHITATGAGAVVRNGSIVGFGSDGILAGNASSTFEKLRVAHNKGHGIYVGNTSVVGTLRVSDSLLEMNADAAISFQVSLNTVGGLVERTRASHNNGGIAGPNLVVYDSVVRANYGIGLANVAARGTSTQANIGGNRSSVISLGGNLDNYTPF